MKVLRTKDTNVSTCRFISLRTFQFNASFKYEKIVIFDTIYTFMSTNSIIAVEGSEDSWIILILTKAYGLSVAVVVKTMKNLILVHYIIIVWNINSYSSFLSTVGLLLMGMTPITFSLMSVIWVLTCPSTSSTAAWTQYFMSTNIFPQKMYSAWSAVALGNEEWGDFYVEQYLHSCNSSEGLLNQDGGYWLLTLTAARQLYRLNISLESLSPNTPHSVVVCCCCVTWLFLYTRGRVKKPTQVRMTRVIMLNLEETKLDCWW